MFIPLFYILFDVKLAQTMGEPNIQPLPKVVQ